MFQKFLAYMLDNLVQRKDQNIRWINLLNSGIHTSVSGAKFTKKQLSIWKHILTASRDGCEKVRTIHYLNMFLKILITIIYIAIWYFLSKWFFTEFNMFSYMNVNGDFWQAIVVIGLPMILYAFLSGQLDWFGSSDPHEDGTLVAESLPFKWLVSFVAGVTEELTHRGALIFVGLISVYLSNMFFVWFVGLICVAICIFILATLETRFVTAGILLGCAVVALIFFRGYLPENPIYTLNGYIFDFLKWITAENIRLTIFIVVLMSGSLALTMALSGEKNYTMSVTEFIVRITMFTLWSIYCMPLGVDAIANMPILPPDANHQTYLLYVGALLWCTAKFRDGHKYQGLAGMMNSYIIGLYMFYIAFTHGLVYAIVLHVLFDAVLFTSEHLCQVIKDRNKMIRQINSS